MPNICCYLRPTVQTVRPAPLFLMLILVLLAPLDATAQGNRLADRLDQASALVRNNRMEEAEQQLNAILKAAPNQAAALNLLGTIRAQQGRLIEAETLFLRVVRIDPHFPGVHMNLAHLYLLKGEPKKTIAELKEVLRLEPSNAEAVDKLARLMLSQGQVDECISFIEQAKHSQALSVPLLVLLGDACLRKGDADKAEESYLLALVKQSDDADAVLGLAQVSQFKRDAKTASLYLSRAKGLVASSPDTLYRFALVALKAGAYEEANAALTQAVKLRPSESAYFLLLGTTWIQKPDLFEAEKAFRRALELQPDSPQAQMSLGYTLLMQKRYPEARVWLEKSIQKDANTPEKFYYLGLIAQEQNEDERAIELFQTAIQLLPSYAYAHVALGSAYLKLRNYSQAQQELETGIKLNPDDSKAHYNLALLYARIKDPQRAQEEMRIVEKLKSKNSGQSRERDVSKSSEPRPPE